MQVNRLPKEWWTLKVWTSKLACVRKQAHICKHVQQVDSDRLVTKALRHVALRSSYHNAAVRIIVSKTEPATDKALGGEPCEASRGEPYVAIPGVG